MNDFTRQFIASVVLAVLTALITVVSVWVQGWLSRRSRDQRRRLMLADANLEIQVIEGLVRAYAVVSPHENSLVVEARRSLEAIQQRLNEQPGVSVDQDPTDLRHALKRLLLLDRPIHGFATLVRASYFVSFLWVMAWIYALVYVALTSDASVAAKIGGTIANVLVAVAPPWGLRALTARLARRGDAVAAPPLRTGA